MPLGDENREFEARYTASGEGEVIAIIRDITERKRTEARIIRVNRLYATLSQINQTIIHTRQRDPLLRKSAR